MDILAILLLILLGLFFCLVELLILPGITIGGILSFGCYGGAIYMAFNDFGTTTGIIVIVAIIAISAIALFLSLRSKTWENLSLNNKIDSSSSLSPQQSVALGARGVTISRLSPMGKVEIGGQSYEAKSVDSYIDAKSEVEVVGFDNSSIVVKIVK